MTAHSFTADAAKRFYDRFGAKQDLQVYEHVALERLAAHGDFEHASAVFELGCGTGRFAEQLLRERLPSDARYVGVDVSSTMIELAEKRLARWKERAVVHRTDATQRLRHADGSFDRFVTTYVLDLLDDATIRGVLAEAHRVLSRGGLVCIASLADGAGPVSRFVSGAWKVLYSVRPQIVGGCRPIRVRDHLEAAAWTVEDFERVSSWGITSDVVVARRR